MSDLRNWLESIGLGQYADLFAQNDIDRDVLADLGERELKSLGVSLGHQKKLLKALAEQDRSHIARTDRASEVQRLAASATVKPELRHLTVMFCDLVGSTALSAQLDPEDLREILRAFQRCSSDSIRQYGGHIARFLGDGVLAYFGFPQAREGDAEGAVNAGLKRVESVAAITSVRQLQVRIGIATGLVVAGDLIGEGSAAEFALVGDAPNLAARLQGLADPNQILVAASTRRLLGRLFELADLGDHDIRGFDKPVRVWRVLRPGTVVSRFEARQTSNLSSLIGRGDELSLLEEKYRKASHGHGQLVLLSGEPGIGKSRLVMALREKLGADTHNLISLQCSSYHTKSALYPLMRYLERAAGITPDIEPSAKLDRLRALVDQSGQPIETVPLLAALLSIPTGDEFPALALTPVQQKRQTFNALLALLESQTTQAPGLLIFEDVHWIDPTSWEFLELIRDRVANLRMLAILLFRPELKPQWPRRSHVTSIAINRLDSVQVISNVLDLYGASAHSLAATVFVPDMKATSQSFLSLASVLLGDISGGLAFGHAAVAEAEKLRHPHSICYALDFLAGAYALCREPEAASPIAERAIRLAGEYGFPVWSAGGHMLRGWAQVELGDTDAGLAEIRQSVDALERTGALTWVRFARYLLAQSLAKIGEREEALKLVDHTLAAIEGTSGRWYEAELSRLKGDLLLSSGGPKAVAEACYETAIAVAKRQSARLWQLRATNALAQLYCTQGRHKEAYDRLTPLYSSFGSEVACADLREAETLLLKIAPREAISPHAI